MESMIEFVHQRIKKHKYQNGIDFTMGNGHDTLFLSDYCHHVYSYDIQSLALNNTKELVKRKKNITLFLKSHEYFDEDVRDFEVGIFNLGYLPGGNHECCCTDKRLLSEPLRFVTGGVSLCGKVRIKR